MTRRTTLNRQNRQNRRSPLAAARRHQTAWRPMLARARVRALTLLAAVVLACLMLAPSTARATVFDLLPSTGTKAVRDAIRARTVLTEEFEINGRKGTMDVSLSDLDWDECVTALLPLAAKGSKGAAGRSLLLESEAAGGMVTRHLVVSAGGQYKTMMFTLDVPQAPEGQDMRQFWPASLPPPLGAKVEMVANLTARGGIYLLFEAYNSGDQTFSSYDSQLRNQGWRSIASDRESNATYISEDETHMLFFVTDERESGTRGSIYIRRLK